MYGFSFATTGSSRQAKSRNVPSSTTCRPSGSRAERRRGSPWCSSATIEAKISIQASRPPTLVLGWQHPKTWIACTFSAVSYSIAGREFCRTVHRNLTTTLGVQQQQKAATQHAPGTMRQLDSFVEVPYQAALLCWSRSELAYGRWLVYYQRS